MTALPAQPKKLVRVLNEFFASLPAHAASPAGRASRGRALPPLAWQGAKIAYKFPALFGAAALGFALNAHAAPVRLDLPAQPLADSLKQLANQAGISMVYDSKQVTGKSAPALRGNLEPQEALRRLLQGSGLRGTMEGDTAIVERLPPTRKSEITTDVVNVRASRFTQVGPLPGLALTKEQIPGNIQSLTAEDIKESRALSLSDLMNSKLQSVNVNDYQSNPFQMDVTYRGFTASPQIGTPQGLSVFLDGVRVNEPFGEVVNWDLIPMNALEAMDVFPGSNPLFGLNTLGGALAMRTKSGFTTQGVSAEVLAGSWGRKQLQASGGWNNGDVAEGGWAPGSVGVFGAVNLFTEDGWRDNSDSDVNQAFGKLEWQGERTGLSLSTLWADNKLRGNGTVPIELFEEDNEAVFTSPDETKNRLVQFQIAGAFDVTDTMSVTGHVYHRDSRRKSSTGDIIDFETFSSQGVATRLPGQADGLQCGYSDANLDGIPDYHVLSSADWEAFQASYWETGTYDPALLGPLNPALPAEFASGLQGSFQSGVIGTLVNNTIQYNGDTLSPEDIWFGSGVSFLDADNNISYVMAAPPLNADTCLDPSLTIRNGMKIPADFTERRRRDGNNPADPQPGWIEGTPTAVITNSDIDQTAKGAALQLNWNLDQHKVMVGASIDKLSASYVGKQRLGLLDEQRNVFSDPSQLGEEYWAGSHDLTINDFEGESETKSLYFSETWSPTQTFNLSFSGRYNETQVDNELAPSIADSELTSLRVTNRYVNGVICPGNDAANCPFSLDGPLPADQFWNLVDPETRAATLGGGANVLDRHQREEFSYYSFNPAIGATWLARPNLNLYANWNKGTRAPSVVELGCAFDDTLVPHPLNPSLILPRSILDQRGCKLPSALSGDPYLPQVVARTAEVGARGQFKGFLEWNVTAYRTEVEDDIYMTSVTNELSFFQSIGDTRRQGIEFGFAGEYGKSDFRLNYSLTEATFQSFFKMISPNNSSRSLGEFAPDRNMIQVEPGNVMPGVPFNNLNLGWGYQLTPKLKLNFNLVAHSSSYLRGNENNAHTPSPGREFTNSRGDTLRTPDNNYSGKAPGYAVLNFHGSYDLGRGWVVTGIVNNVLDKEYFTAGRLGVNPFAPSTLGAIGPGGFNYNSAEWISSQFIAPGAPRGVWLALSYDFDASRRYEPPPSSLSMVEPDRTLARPSQLPTGEELALMKRLDTLKALPVLKRAPTDAATQTAEAAVRARVEAWRQAQAAGDAAAYLAAYAPSYAPAGVSHDHWAERQQLKYTTEAAPAVEVSDLVVAPQGERMVAVFRQQLKRGDEIESRRKVLTFEQREGQWKITRDHELSTGTMAKAAPAKTAMTNNTPAVREAE